MTDRQEIFDALQSPIRREILSLVWDREMAAGDIAAAFDLSAPTISQHLKTLRAAGLIDMVADGNFRRYRANPVALRAARSMIGNYDERWRPADELPEADRAAARSGLAVIASVDVHRDLGSTFAAFIDEKLYSEWLGVPVSIRNGRFACTLEWGTRIRGHYDIVHPDALIALRWDFEDDNVPVPGGEMVGYMRFSKRRNGCRIEVHQLCDTPQQVEFMDVAWRMALGRYHEYVESASKRNRAPRSPRPKLK